MTDTGKKNRALAINVAALLVAGVILAVVLSALAKLNP